MQEAEGNPARTAGTNGRATDEPIRSGRFRGARSSLKDFGAGLGAVDFADHIVLFGASLLLSVLPLIILLGALASQRVDDDTAQHLGLNAPASRVGEGLFTHSNVTLNLGIVIAVFWIGLAVLASFYFSSTLVSDGRTYGTIGVAFTLVTWFIAMGAVITLGAVIGVLTLKPSPLRQRPTQSSQGD